MKVLSVLIGTHRLTTSQEIHLLNGLLQTFPLSNIKPLLMFIV